jgi:hypothetical protein
MPGDDGTLMAGRCRSDLSRANGRGRDSEVQLLVVDVVFLCILCMLALWIEV